MQKKYLIKFNTQSQKTNDNLSKKQNSLCFDI